MYLVPAKPWYSDDAYPHNAFGNSIFEDNPGQGHCPERLHMPSFMDLLDTDPCIGSDYSTEEESNCDDDL